MKLLVFVSRVSKYKAVKLSQNLAWHGGGKWEVPAHCLLGAELEGMEQSCELPAPKGLKAACPYCDG